jgi:hypothetical protein
VQNPHFADLSPASFERVLLDLIAHHGDMTSYYQDRVAAGLHRRGDAAAFAPPACGPGGASLCDVRTRDVARFD